MSALVGLTGETARDLILSVGTHSSKRPLSPVEVAEALEAALATGMALADLARAIQLEDTTIITRFRRLLRLAPEIRHLVAWGNSPGSLSFTTAAEIARLTTGPDQDAVAKATLEHRLSSSEVRQVVQIVQRSATGASGAVASVVMQRPQIERVHVLVGAILGSELQEMLRGMTQQQRDQLLDSAVHRQAPTLPAWTGRLGADRFTLTGDEDFATALTKRLGGFEVAINHYLETELAM